MLNVSVNVYLLVSLLHRTQVNYCSVHASVHHSKPGGWLTEDFGPGSSLLFAYSYSLAAFCWLIMKQVNVVPLQTAQCWMVIESWCVRGLYLTLQSVNLSGKLHSVSAEVVHGDGVIPVAEVVLLTGWLLLPPHAEHGQQHSLQEESENVG